MAHLTIVVDVDQRDLDGAELTPAELADLVLSGQLPYSVNYAKWGETLRGNALQFGDANTQVNNFGPD